MKKLLFVLPVLLMVFQSCQKGKLLKPKENVDTLINKKFLDTIPLKVSSYYVDSAENMYVFGRKNKFWMGVFNKDSVKLFDRTFTEDPDSIVINNNGSAIKLDSLIISRVIDLGEDLYVIRLLATDRGVHIIPGFFQAATRYNKKNKTVKTFYSKSQSTTGALSIIDIVNWVDGYILINAVQKLAVTIIADRNLNIIGRFQPSFPRKDAYIPLSMYVSIVDRYVLRMDLRISGYSMEDWKTPIFTDVPASSKIVLIT